MRALCLACSLLAFFGCKESARPSAGVPDALPPRHLPERSADGGVELTVRERSYGSKITITVAARSSPAVLAAIDAAFAEIDRIEPALSDWKDVSELNTLNQRAGQEPMPVSPELFELLSFTRRLSEVSDGGFDVTFASMYGLWSFKPGEERVPTAAELAARLPAVDYRRVVLDPARRTALITQAGTRIGLGSVSDGYSAHRASVVLTRLGFGDHLVLAGGDGCASGSKLERPWRVGIRDPETGGVWGALELKDEAIATSGNYQKFFFKDGVRYHHILDARTGLPARGTSSVTVVTKGAIMADGWATTLFILGPERGLAVAQREGLEALWFDEAFKVTATPGMLARLQRDQLKAP